MVHLRQPSVQASFWRQARPIWSPVILWPCDLRVCRRTMKSTMKQMVRVGVMAQMTTLVGIVAGRWGSWFLSLCVLPYPACIPEINTVSRRLTYKCAANMRGHSHHVYWVFFSWWRQYSLGLVGSIVSFQSSIQSYLRIAFVGFVHKKIQSILEDHSIQVFAFHGGLGSIKLYVVYCRWRFTGCECTFNLHARPFCF